MSYKVSFQRLKRGLNYLKKYGIKKTTLKVSGIFFPSLNIKAKRLIAYYRIGESERNEQINKKFSKSIKFSILVPLYNTPINFLNDMLSSVIAQTYQNWELCISDSSDSSHKIVGETVLALAKDEKRIKYKKLKSNRGISENTNDCLKMATGDYIALLDHDDILNEAALYEMMIAICDKGADFIYTDEAVFQSPKMSNIKVVHCKSDYSIDTLRAVNYICHFTAFSAKLIEKSGTFRSEYDGSQDHDLFLRLTSIAENIVHIPKILYYWRSHSSSVASDVSSKSYAVEAGKKAVADNIKTYGYSAYVTSSRANPTMYRIKYELKAQPKVSIIIPNKNHLEDLKKCISSILKLSTYKNYEIIIVDNGSNEPNLFEYYKELKKNSVIKICSLDIEFNFSKLNNFAVSFAKGDYYILLNNDIEIITPEWIEEMLMYVQREDVGAAGAMLYYPDDTIQHAGIIVGLGGVAGHCFLKEPRNSIGYMGRLCYAQNLSAVTAACMMVKASVFKEVGGLDETFEIAYNDVDFCLRIRKAGYLIVWTPFAEAYHYESKSRGYENTPEKIERFNKEKAHFQNKWKNFLLAGDPYYNPNLAIDTGNFDIKEL